MAAYQKGFLILHYTSIEHAWKNLFNDGSMRFAQNDLIIAQM